VVKKVEFWEEWFRHRPFRRFFRELDKAFEEMFKEFTTFMPKELMKEQKLPNGSTIRTFGPVVYGYSLTVGPDGVPKVRTFGNVKPIGPIPKAIESREPLVDVIQTPNEVRVTAELPGIEKKDINLQATESKLTISADTHGRKYFKEVELPARVDPKSADATYNNGILEVTLKKLKEFKEGERISIR
jgi:HSP20 family protein